MADSLVAESSPSPVRRTSSAASPFASSGSPKCPACGKSVYPMEELRVDEARFHKSCFRCTECKGVLSAGKFAALDGKYYCTHHFKQLFALKGNYNEGFGTEPHKNKWRQPSPVTAGSAATSETASLSTSVVGSPMARVNGLS
ncbi:hypothetical protein M427DRAFT_159899 [Gonapodya prolifera JEL478]|uniref:LIM zinc-binding domain-containing protein n=1 Tax=Gonapodya prolifera (strain JEL478) TaxID=1344416 RepID=A0A138ZZZ0_GONPJ|nr:hypothetical protein M427DRAFT_159899 [Gonapodya prolifera JEL478]|eukprot:KXS10042.1 hypothetical protein M427DRAFT_159899 [Gonapodya prolifera JEL478]